MIHFVHRISVCISSLFRSFLAGVLIEASGKSVDVGSSTIPKPSRWAVGQRRVRSESITSLSYLTGLFSPVGLKEAALDSPTFRATTLHFSEQVDLVEKWLDGYVKSAAKLTSELSTVESLSNSFISYVTTPINVSEAVVDHDYSLLAMKRLGESAKDFWFGVIATLRKVDTLISEPIRAFVQGDLRSFKVDGFPVTPLHSSRLTLSELSGNSSGS